MFQNGNENETGWAWDETTVDVDEDTLHQDRDAIVSLEDHGHEYADQKDGGHDARGSNWMD